MSVPAATGPTIHLARNLMDGASDARETPLSGNLLAVPRIAPAATPFALECRNSPIHRFGVFVQQDIPANARIIEYTGERISYREGTRRALRPQLYLFWLGPGLLIDGAIGGSGAEFVNHSCEPNVAAELTEGRVFFRSLREIAAGEELLLDYKMHGDAQQMVCRCGAVACRGFLDAP